ncbi:energy-coupling factor transporter transmembrane protein EcfT [Ectothiorhodospira variabilis]|uniref:energy-coupling factor transporter transmembrane protein EcfT n=1 Tax=Ectothiorhodospira variabilis TaxID=505694 RepID=UPI001EFACD94|nr:energy-coupling factor transporter transmembrane protein EcfT [Ectothiorhodospira variabilis]MCG5495306.1 energy-coupling factor transporter transmembrane protein EcfT [Ectothiorhodospira variabilis]MCG5497453.1 energy-coupling factor transporter transmembrane protein EcfT [Ectothiorhodospira variabilis]MCG5504904.1 energy-coupling factor transporter transmembrane protein EcfT [Ectothiorhodospira variabilis]MCG5508061.1 energy-coupling factor transporter transmembrane protein EcfT [Ectothior
MHPATKILGVILFILCVARANPAVIAGGCCWVALGLWHVGREGVDRFLTMVGRLKWFFLSIILVFGWFTPGTPLLALAPELSPSREGLLLGLQRSLVLVLAVGAVVWLLETTRRDDLVKGLLWLTRPLAILGFPRERFAVRLVLTLEALPRVGLLAREARDRPREAPRGVAERLQGLGERAAGLFQGVLHQAQQAPLEPIHLAPVAAPGWRDWLGMALVILPLMALAVGP